MARLGRPALLILLLLSNETARSPPAGRSPRADIFYLFMGFRNPEIQKRRDVFDITIAFGCYGAVWNRLFVCATVKLLRTVNARVWSALTTKSELRPTDGPRSKMLRR
ncbi:hypothetical protein EVAR_9340_1 [Eumeta japonica]|uniref:Uncharacterized protein n=1 Tax=Eumeta variegata TaxID=151549 RepID=A0A4C1YTX7_EUMVA|nr:hypothetical protein EVAR_9340_1 [Eumeta japonica]